MKSFLNRCKKIIFGDFIGKTISLMIAVFLWYYVNVISLEKRYISLPITLMNAPEDKDINIPSDLVVSVEISSHEDVSRRIEEMSAIIDLSDYQIGERNYPITVINLPKDIQYSFSPKHKQINIYDVITNEVPINFVVSSNSLLTNVSYSPKTVTIVGATKAINAIKALNTEKFNYRVPISETLKTNIAISVPNNIQILSEQNVEATLFFNQNVYTNRVFLPVEYDNLNSNFVAVGDHSITMTILTTTPNIENILLGSRVGLEFADISNVGIHDVPIKINTPTNMIVLEAPKTLSVGVINNTDQETFNEVFEASLEGIAEKTEKPQPTIEIFVEEEEDVVEEEIQNKEEVEIIEEVKETKEIKETKENNSEE